MAWLLDLGSRCYSFIVAVSRAQKCDQLACVGARLASLGQLHGARLDMGMLFWIPVLGGRLKEPMNLHHFLFLKYGR